MSRAIALSALRGQIRKEADIGPDTTSASARWPDADVNAIINRNWQALRRKLVQTNGARTLYCKPASGTLTIGATAPYSWGNVAMPADLAHLVGIEITMPNGRRRSLTPCSWSMRNENYNAFGTQLAPPESFFIYNIGVESGASVTAGSIGIVPAPDSAYPYTLWYLPPWVDRTQDADVFDGVEGFEEWVLWQSVLDVAAADGDMAATAQIAAAKLNAVEEDILRAANNIQRVGPICRQDVARLEREEKRDTRYRWY